LKVDNLWQFTELTKLQLDNSIIEKIERLDALVNLRWLGKVWHCWNDTVWLSDGTSLGFPS